MYVALYTGVWKGRGEYVCCTTKIATYMLLYMCIIIIIIKCLLVRILHKLSAVPLTVEHYYYDLM